MSQSLTAPTNDTLGWLAKMAEQQNPVVIHCRVAHEWTTFKSRFLGHEQDRGLIYLASPSNADVGELDLYAGQSLGITLREGHRKYLFEAQYAGACRFPLHLPDGVQAMAIANPDEVRELQRRLYHRSKVPSRVTIPVDLASCIENKHPTRHATPNRGIMLDLSAGGMSLAIPAAEPATAWQPGDRFTCTFALEAGQPPQRVTAELRHCEKVPEGHLRLGVQFVGLEGSMEGYRTLQTIGRTARRFQRLGGRARRV